MTDEDLTAKIDAVNAHVDEIGTKLWERLDKLELTTLSRVSTLETTLATMAMPEPEPVEPITQPIQEPTPESVVEIPVEPVADDEQKSSLPKKKHWFF